jgi:2-oxoisovalerate dehydrogenase E1 component
MISHLGPQLGVADGIALANKLKKNGSYGCFYWKVPHPKEIFMKLEYCFGLGIACSFVIENNGYGFQHQQMSNTDVKI